MIEIRGNTIRFHFDNGEIVRFVPLENKLAKLTDLQGNILCGPTCADVIADNLCFIARKKKKVKKN